MAGTFTYDPGKITGFTKDRMRFELGDTIVDGGAETSVLADEEYESVLSQLPDPITKRSWSYGKLGLLEAIMFRLSYQVDTKVDVLSYALGKRAELWRSLYEQLKKELMASASIPSIHPSTQHGRSYFEAGMQENVRSSFGFSPYAPTLLDVDRGAL